MTKQKIISGSYAHVNKSAKSHTMMGWRIITKKKWSDGRWTYVIARD